MGYPYLTCCWDTVKPSQVKSSGATRPRGDHPDPNLFGTGIFEYRRYWLENSKKKQSWRKTEIKMSFPNFWIKREFEKTQTYRYKKKSTPAGRVWSQTDGYTGSYSYSYTGSYRSRGFWNNTFFPVHLCSPPADRGARGGGVVARWYRAPHRTIFTKIKKINSTDITTQWL